MTSRLCQLDTQAETLQRTLETSLALNLETYQKLLLVLEAKDWEQAEELRELILGFKEAELDAYIQLCRTIALMEDWLK